MTITQITNLSRWPASFPESVHGAITTRAGVFHSPHGSVEVLTQQYHMARATPATTLTTRLRMVHAGIGWEYADDNFHAPDKLALLAAAFANVVASKAIHQSQEPKPSQKLVA